MNRPLQVLLFAVLFTAVGLCHRVSTASTFPAPDPLPIDVLWETDVDPAIEFKDDANQTFGHNEERWKAQIDKKHEGKIERRRRLNLRNAILRQRIKQKFGPDKVSGDIDFWIANHYIGAGQGGLAFEHLKRVIDEHPGDPIIALRALETILRHGGWKDGNTQNDNGRAWVGYAARRLIALERAGMIDASHPSVVQAMHVMARMAIEQGDYHEADRLLRRAADTGIDVDRTRLHRVDLEMAIGRLGVAQDELRELSHLGWDAEQRLRVIRPVVDVVGMRDLPIDRNAELRWHTLKRIEPAERAESVMEAVETFATGDRLMPLGDQTYTSAWTAFESMLLSDQQAAIAAARQRDSNRAQMAWRTAQRNADPQEMLEVFRRWPWSQAGLEASLGYGSIQLQRGAAAEAERAFTDVLWRTGDSALAGRARVGRWLAMAQQPDRHLALTESLREIDAGATYPWFTQSIRGKALRERLFDAIAAVGGGNDDDASAWTGRPVVVQAPAAARANERDVPAAIGQHMPPAQSRLAVGHGVVIAAGPDALRAIDPATNKTLWQRSHPAFAEADDPYWHQVIVPPHTPRPTVHDGRVVTCWGLTMSRTPATIAALDAPTGRTLWTSAAFAATMSLRPVGDPAVSGNRVYAVMRGAVTDLPPGPTSLMLVCFDAATGQPIWLRGLGTVGHTAPFRIDDNDVHVDVLHDSASMTVAGGYVYVNAPGMSLAADVRDGQVHWLVSHDRPALDTAAAAILPRRASPPVVTETHVFVAPRDWHGLIAIKRDTGQVQWKRRYLAPWRLLGGDASTLYAASSHNVFAIEAQNGAVRWNRRLDGAIDDAIMPNARTILLAGPQGIDRVAAEDGRVTDHLSDAPTAAIGVADNRLIAASQQPGEPVPADLGPSLDVVMDQAYPEADALSEMLTGGNRIAAITPGMGPAYRALVFGDGTATLIDAGDKPRVAWRQAVASGAKKVLWTQFAVTLVYQHRVVGLDINNGQKLFDTAMDFPIGLTASEQRYLAVGKVGNESQLVMIDTETGSKLWHRTLADYGPDRKYVGLVRIAWHQRKLVALAGVQIPENQWTQLTFDPASGRVERQQAIMEHDGNWLEDAAVAGDRWWMMTDKRQLLTVRFDQPDKPTEHAGNFKKFHPHDNERFDPVGQYLLLDHNSENLFWISNANDAKFVQQREKRVFVRDDRMHEFDGQTISAFNIRDGKRVAAYQIGSEGHPSDEIHVIDLWYDQKYVHVASAHELEDSNHTRLRLDTYEQDGTHTAGRVLGALNKGASESLRLIATDRDVPQPIQRIDNRLVVVDDGRTYVYDASPKPTAMLRRPAAAAFVADPAFRPDGSVNEWQDTPAHSVSTRDGRSIDLRFAYQDNRLVVVSTVDDQRVDPMSGDPSNGDRMVVYVHAEGQTNQHVLGMGRRGSVLVTTQPDYAQGASSIDARTLRRTYELAVAVSNQPVEDVDELAVQIKWYNGAAGDEPIAVWPSSRRGERAAISARPLEGRTIDAVAEIARQLPAMPQTRELIAETMNDLAGDPAMSLELANRALRAAPDAPWAYDVMCMLDTSLRRTPDDPRVVEAVVKVAQAAGVKSSTREKYKAIAGAALSQWVYAPADEMPQRARLLVHDGRDWEGRIYMGNSNRDEFGVRPSDVVWHLGPLTPGKWTELRIPVLAIGIHDRPIHGMHFLRSSGGMLYWDDTAVIANGKTQIFIGDDTPEGRRTGKWEWTDKLRHSGRRSHFSGNSRNDDAHAIASLKAPIGFHLREREPDADPPAEAEIQRVLIEQIPRLGASDQAASMFSELWRNGGVPEQRSIIDFYFWFVKNIPHHPGRIGYATKIVAHAKSTGTDETRKMIVEHLADRRVPKDVAYHIRSEYLEPNRKYVQSWLVHGPLAHDDGPMAIHEQDNVSPKRPLQSVEFDQWKQVLNRNARIEFGDILGKGGQQFGAYALCWIRSDRPRDLKLALGVDDTSKIWINGELVHQNNEYIGDGPGKASADIQLNRGWNTVLTKVVNTGGGPWYMYFELVDTNPAGSLDGIVTSIEPPTGR